MIEALQYEFIRNALIAGLLTSVACGIIGSLIVVNRVVFISGGIAHAAYGGIGIAIFLGISPLVGAGLFALLISMIIGLISFHNRERSDTIIGVLWAVGMAVGIIFVDLSPGYSADLMSYLFGSILTVPRYDLWLMAALDGIIALTILYFYKEFLAMSYDEEFAALRGIPVKALYFVLLGLVACTIVLTIRVVGLILVIALLTMPTYIAEKISRSLARMMCIAFVLSAAFTLTGLWFSYTFNISSGASIIIVAAVVFIAFSVINWIKGERR